MLCHHYKCIFVHIPKNAGQSVERVFLNLLGLTWRTRAPLLLRANQNPALGPPRLAHLKADEYVRYQYVPQIMFDEYFKFAFVRNPWCRLVSLYKYLEYVNKCDFKTFLFSEFKKTLTKEMPWFISPQRDFICSDDGTLLVDYIGRFESLQNDFNVVCEKIGIPKTKLPHINKSPASVSPAYQDYYDEESMEFVAQFYQKDIEMFDYNF